MAWRVIVKGVGTTPLFITSHKGHAESVAALLDAGAAVNKAQKNGPELTQHSMD